MPAAADVKISALPSVVPSSDDFLPVVDKADYVTKKCTVADTVASAIPADVVRTSRTINGQALSSDVVLTASDVGADPAGSAAAVAGDLAAHEGLSTAAHGWIVADTDPRLTDARTPTSHASTHDAGGADALAIDAAAATGSLRTLGTSSTSACAGNDSRLSDARTPSAHATSHKSGGTDAIKLDELAAPTDITTLNASETAHGLLPKLSGSASDALRGNGAWAAAGDVVGPSSATDNAIARYDTTTGKLIQNSSASVDDEGTASVYSLKLYATPTVGSPVVGQIYVNTAEGGLPQFQVSPTVSQTVGAELYVPVVNKTGATLTDGSVVYIGSAQGNRPTAVLARADAYSTSSIVGIVTADITDNAEGFVTTFGNVHGFNTSGFAEGATLYLSPTNAGQLTSTVPATPNFVVRVGIALNSTNNGTVYVHPHQALAANVALGTDPVAPTHGAVKSYVDTQVGTKLDKQYAVDEQRYGLINRTETTLSFDGTDTLTLGSVGASWSYYRTGVKYTITGGKTKVLATPMVDGTLYYIYIDATDGTLSCDTGGWTLADTKVPVATVFWNSTLTPKFVLADERHSCQIDRAFHREHHYVEGTKASSYGTITGLVAGSDTPADKTFGISGTAIFDEDMKIALADFADPDGATAVYPVLYRTSATTYSWLLSDMPFKYTTSAGPTYGYGEYDLNGTSTPAALNQFFNSYVFASNSVANSEANPEISTSTTRYFIMQGRGVYSSAALATAEKFLVSAGMPVAEGVALYQITWSTTNRPDTVKGRCRYVSTQQISGNVITTSSISATEHNGLAGLDGWTAGEYYHATAAEYTATATTGSGNLARLTSPVFTTPAVIGSSTGKTSFASANASATNYTATLPAATGTLAYTSDITKAAVGLSNVTDDVQTKASIVPNTAPAAWQIPVGNLGGTAYAPVSASGDATIGATGAVTIANGAVTYAKMQDVSATSRVIGRKTAGAGDPEELTLSETLDFVGSAAQWDLLYRGASTWTRLGAGTSGQYLKTNGTGANPEWGTVSASGGGFWTAVPGSPTRASNTTLTVTGDYTSLIAKWMVMTWTESSTRKYLMVDRPSTYGSPNTTVTFIGDTMASIDASSLKYATVGAEAFAKDFNVATGAIGATATNISLDYVIFEPMKLLGAEIWVGTAGTTNSTTIDINKNWSTAFTTKPTLATTVKYSPYPFTADSGTTVTIGDSITVDIDAVQTTAAVDLSTKIYLFPTRYAALS